MSVSLYQPTTAETVAITRETRWLGRLLRRPSGSPVDPAFYVRKIMEVAAAACDIIPPPNGRIYLVRGVKVKSVRPWDEAVRAGAPETSEQSGIWKDRGAVPVAARRQDHRARRDPCEFREWHHAAPHRAHVGRDEPPRDRRSARSVRRSGEGTSAR